MNEPGVLHHLETSLRQTPMFALPLKAEKASLKISPAA